MIIMGVETGELFDMNMGKLGIQNDDFRSQMKSIFQPQQQSNTTNYLQKDVKEDLLNANILCIGKGGMVILDLPGGQHSLNLKDEIYTMIEQTFQTIGGGTGCGKKTDKYNHIFHQLVVAKLGNEDDVKLLSGYRYLEWSKDRGSLHTPMRDMFDIKDDSILLNDKLKVLELGTAWSHGVLDRSESLLSFSGTWNGLAELTGEYEPKDMLIGKMTIPSNYDKKATIFALKYLEMASSKDSCGVTPSSKANFDMNGFLTIDEIKDLEKDIAELSGDYNQDKLKLKEVLKQEKYGNVGDLPAMFPLYLSRFKKGEWYYTGTVSNGNVSESGIVVPMLALEDGVHKTYKSSSNSKIKGKTLGEYIGGKNN